MIHTNFSNLESHNHVCIAFDDEGKLKCDSKKYLTNMRMSTAACAPIQMPNACS